MKFRTIAVRFLVALALTICFSSVPALAQEKVAPQESVVEQINELPQEQFDLLISEVVADPSSEKLSKLLEQFPRMTQPQMEALDKLFKYHPELLRLFVADLMLKTLNRVLDTLQQQTVKSRYSDDYLNKFDYPNYFQQLATQVESTATESAQNTAWFEKNFKIRMFDQDPNQIIYDGKGGAIVPSVSAVDNGRAPRCVRTAVIAEPKPWGGFVEVGTTMNRDRKYGQMNVFLTKGSWWLWGQSSTTYSQVYGGPRFNLKSVEIGIGLGVEQDKNPLRVGGYLFYAKGKFSQLNLLETGGSGFWYRNQSDFAVTNRWSMGFFSQRFDGSGLRIARKLPWNLQIWGAILRRSEGLNFVGGLRRTIGN